MATKTYRITCGQYPILLDWMKKRKQATCHSLICDSGWDVTSKPSQPGWTVPSKQEPKSTRPLSGCFCGGIFITETGLVFKSRGGGHKHSWSKQAVQVAGTPCSARARCDWLLRRSLAQHFLCLMVTSSSTPSSLWLREGNLTFAARVPWGPLSPG